MSGTSAEAASAPGYGPPGPRGREESLPSGPFPVRHAQPSMSGRTVSSVQGQADRVPTHTRGALPEDCGPSGPVRRGGTCRQGGVRGAEGRPRRGPAAVRRLHPMEAAGLLTPKPQACRGRRPLLPGFTRPGDSAMARAAARDLAAGRGSSGQTHRGPRPQLRVRLRRAPRAQGLRLFSKPRSSSRGGMFSIQ